MTGEPGPISAIIPARNKAAFLAPCVGSVVTAATHRPGTRVILVENGSTDGTAEEAERLFGHRLQVLRAPEATAGAARNAGAAGCRTGILCFLDADVQVPPDYFVRLDQHFRVELWDAAGCTVAMPEDASWVARTWGRLHERGVASFDGMINSGNFAIRAEVFHSLGGFNGALVTGEDADICLRLVEGGHLLLDTPALCVTHHDNPASMAGFLAKEVWHGLGAAATLRRTRLDRPFAMTLVHGILLLAAVSLLLIRPDANGLAFGLIAASAVPILAVAYRRTLAASPPRWLPSVALYEVYFLARLVALFRSGLHSVRGRPQPGPSRNAGSGDKLT